MAVLDIWLETRPEFAVLGLIDLDAVPPEEAHIPISDLDPLPLVRFHSRRSKESRSAVRKKRPRKPKPKRRR